MKEPVNQTHTSGLSQIKQGVLLCVQGRGHGPLKFTWKWEINLSHLSTLAQPNNAGPNQEAAFMHLNHKFHLGL